MAVDIRPGAAALDAQLNAVRDLIDTGRANFPGTVTVYGGDEPGQGPVLGVLSLSRPCAPDAVDGELTFNPIADCLMAEADGTATWVRIENGDGVLVLDGNVQDENGEAFITIVPSTEIRRGGPIRIEALSLRF